MFNFVKPLIVIHDEQYQALWLDPKTQSQLAYFGHTFPKEFQLPLLMHLW